MNEKSDLQSASDDSQSGWTTDLSPAPTARNGVVTVPPFDGVPPASPSSRSRSRLIDRALEEGDPRIFESALDGFPTK